MKYSFFLLTILFLQACNSKKEQSAEPKENTTITNQVTLTNVQMQSANIQTGSLQENSLSAILKVNGKIDVPPQNMVSVSMPLGGYLKSTKLLPGIHVSKGEVIASLEDQQYIQLQQDYLTIKSKLVFSEAEYIRQKELNQSKASSDKVFQLAQMEFQGQKILLSALAEKLKLININPQSIAETNISRTVNIYSPINGFVSKVNVNIGKYVTPSDVLFELVNPSDIHLNITVFERDLDKVYIGQKLWAYTNNETSKKHLCEINLISKDLSAERTAEIHCHFEQYDKMLVPGMYMNADIKIKTLKTATLPEEAIVNFEGIDYIFIALPQNKFTMTAIETGLKEKGIIEIKNADGLTGKAIVTKNAYTLLMTLKNKSEE